MLCPYCHSQNIDNAEKCLNCGQVLVRRVGPPPMVNSTGVGIPISTEILEQVSTNPELAHLLENKLRREEEEIKKKSEKKERAKKRRKKFLKGLLITFVCLIIMAIVAVVACFSIKYSEGNNLLEQGQYKEAYIIFNSDLLKGVTYNKRIESAQGALDNGKYGQLMYILIKEPTCLSEILVNENNINTLYKGVVYKTNHVVDDDYSNYEVKVIKRVINEKLSGYKDSIGYLNFLKTIEEIDKNNVYGDERYHLIALTLFNVLKDFDASKESKSVAKKIVLHDDIIFAFLADQRYFYDDIEDDPDTILREGYYTFCDWHSTTSKEDMEFCAGEYIGSTVNIKGTSEDCKHRYFKDGVCYEELSDGSKNKLFKIEVVDFYKIKVYNYTTKKTTTFERGDSFGYLDTESGVDFLYS